jgi:hypothetical protein
VLILLFVVLCGLAIVGGITLWRWGRVGRHPTRTENAAPQATEIPSFSYPNIPNSKLPGPLRNETLAFELDENNSQIMIGMDDPTHERWCDIAGNFYSSALITNFRYDKPGENGPFVRVCIIREAPTLTGRLEAHGLKPNFAYQIKLRGMSKDKESFEKIGYIGRWRLPGMGTNYTDDDYRAYPFKESVESYILFDFFVTDRNGNAVRDFALDSSLHVLFNAARQGGDVQTDDIVPVIVDPSNIALYASPKRNLTRELIWAQRETGRYTSADQVIRLPPGSYNAELVLTEESFHSPYNDGGYWATVCRLPIVFTVTEK